MKFPFFIAKKLVSGKNKSFTRVIVYIAIAGVAISIATMIMATAVINGFKTEINSKIFGFWGHIHVYDAGIMRNFELKPIDVSSKLVNELKLVKKVEYQTEGIKAFNENVNNTQGGIRSVHPYIILPSLIESKSEMVAALFKGIDQHYDWSSMSKYIISGTHPVFKDSTLNEILISRDIAEKLSLSPGKKMIITFIKNKQKLRKALLVKGIYKTGLEEYDNKFILGNARLAQEILDWREDQYSGIEVVLDDMKDMDIINDYIYSQILPRNYYSETIREKFPNIFDWLKLQDINEKVIVQLMAIVAIINLITILLILILERTPMIGIFKAMGATNVQIRSIFIFNAAFILFLGLLIGNVLGLGLSWIQQEFKVIRLDEKNYYLDFAPIKFELGQLLLINVYSFIVCVLFLVIPSMIISRMQPVRSIKFD